MVSTVVDDGRFGELKVVVLVAPSDAPDASATAAAGWPGCGGSTCSWLTKPLRRSHLLTTVSTLLQRTPDSDISLHPPEDPLSLSALVADSDISYVSIPLFIP